MKKKVIIIFVLIVLLAVLLCGCWSSAEIENLAIVLAIGIENGDEGKDVKMVAQHIIPKELKGGGTTPKYINLINSGSNLLDISEEMNQFSSRELFFPHNQVVIVDEKYAAEKGIKCIIDYFNRSDKFRRTVPILISKGTTPLEILNTPSVLEDIPAQEIAQIATNFQYTSNSAVCNLKEFIRLYSEDGTEAYSGGVKIISSDNVSSSDNETSKKIKKLMVSETAVFKEDKLVGWLNEKQSRGLLWLRGQLKQAIINVKVDYKDITGQAIVEILKSNTKITPEINNDKASFKIEIRAEGMMRDETGSIDLVTSQDIEMLQKLCAEEIEKEIKSALTVAKDELGTDVFGFGQIVHRKYPNIWNKIKPEWEKNYYLDCVVNFDIQVHIESIGLVTNQAEKSK